MNVDCARKVSFYFFHYSPPILDIGRRLSSADKPFIRSFTLFNFSEWFFLQVCSGHFCEFVLVFSGYKVIFSCSHNYKLVLFPFTDLSGCFPF